MIIWWKPYGNIKKEKEKKKGGSRDFGTLPFRILHSYYVKKTLDMLKDAFPLQKWN